MTTMHILNLVLAAGIVGSLATVCRIAFLVAGHRAVAAERPADERLAA